MTNYRPTDLATFRLFNCGSLYESSLPEALSPRLLRLISELDEDWRRLDDRLEVLSAEIESLSENDAACHLLMTVPGIGPIISSAVVAAIGTGSGFKQGRDLTRVRV